MIPKKHPNDKPRAACNYCGIDYAANTKLNGTSTLRNHIENQCKKYPLSVRVEDKKQKLLSLTKKSGGEDTEECASSLVAVSWSKEGARQSLAKYIILDELPFIHVEGEGFRQFVKYMQPKFDPPSRITVARDIYQMFLYEKEKLRKVLKGQRICVTTDTWTSIQNICYMCVTAHWIDRNWVLQKRIISFVQVPNHKGDTIAVELVNCFKDWGGLKLFSVTVDNASSNDVAIDKLRKKYEKKKDVMVLNGKMLHMRCVCHIINLIVGDGLKDVHTSISSIRNAVRYVRSSPARLQKFKEYVAEENIESKSLLCLDVQTRWNSTYLMLEAALKFQKSFERLEDDESYSNYFSDGFNEKRIDGPPSDDDWANAKVFVRFLNTFYTLTLKFSGSLYSTSNLYLDRISDVHRQLKRLVNCQDPILSKLAICIKSLTSIRGKVRE
ncbi:hypothetical protein CsatB_026480 [Cannabis sativa]